MTNVAAKVAQSQGMRAKERGVEAARQATDRTLLRVSVNAKVRMRTHGDERTMI